MPPGWPLGVWAAMLNVGIVGEGRLGMAPFTGCPEPLPASMAENDIHVLLETGASKPTNLHAHNNNT